jgi:peptide/nickel transport system permease protein
MTGAEVTVDVAARPSRRRGIVRWLGGRESAAGVAIVTILIVVAVFAPFFAPYDPEAINADLVLAPPSLEHPFGSDSLGRDVLSRVIYALRVSLVVAIGSVGLALLVGIPIGLLAGFRGGYVDGLFMRPLDLLLSLPPLLLAVAMIAIVGPGALIALFAIAIIYLPIIARVIRSSVLVVREHPYVDGARARGASELAVARRHVLPNSLGPSLVQATVLMGFAIQIEAALSFLGLGAQPPTPSLGLMLSDGRDVITIAPWVEVFPGLALALVVLGFNLVGDGLRRRLDPRGMAR